MSTIVRSTYPTSRAVTHNVKDAIRSEVVKFTPALHLVKFPVEVSNEISVPKAA